MIVVVNLDKDSQYLMHIYKKIKCQKTIVNDLIFSAAYQQQSFYYVNYGSSLYYYVKNNLSNENINTGVSVVFKTKCEFECQNELP